MVRLVSILRPTGGRQGERNRRRTEAFTAVAAAMALMGQMAVPVLADEGRGLEAVPFEFVGKAGDCGAAAGSRIVTAAWLKGMGLPDTDDPNKKDRDRKSTRLNSSHGYISYAVFCLKKKSHETTDTRLRCHRQGEYSGGDYSNEER